MFIMKIATLGAMITTLFIANAHATDYPITSPEAVNASISINTNNQEKFNNRLLATNIFGFTSATQQELIKGSKRHLKNAFQVVPFQ